MISALDDGVYIRKIPEDMQLARAEKKSYGLAVHETVLGAATHAFVLTGFELANSFQGEWHGIAGTATAYPTDKVDLLSVAAVPQILVPCDPCGLCRVRLRADSRNRCLTIAGSGIRRFGRQCPTITRGALTADAEQVS
jgi:hypothetical protein